MLIRSELSPQETLQHSDLVTQKILIAEKIYNLSQKIKALQLRKKEFEQQLRPKTTIGLGTIIGTGIVTSILSGPALTVNYLNQYTTPVAYQSSVDKASLGVAGSIAALSALFLAKRGTLATYDYFMYDKNMQVVKKNIESIDAQMTPFYNEIRKLVDSSSEIFSQAKIDYSEEAIYKELVNLYQTNPNTITKNFINLRLLASKKADLIFESHNIKTEGESFFKSSGNLALDITFGVIAAPWLLLGALLGGAAETSQINKNNEEIELIDEIIKKLKTLR